MALYLQYRQICKRVDQQLNSLKDEEQTGSGQADHTHRLSGVTANLPSPIEKEKSDDEPVPQDSQTALYTQLPGVSLKYNEKDDGSKEEYLHVDFDSSDDPQNPRNWKTSYRLVCTIIISLIGFVMTASSASDSATAEQAAMALGVSPVAESLATAMFLIGFG